MANAILEQLGGSRFIAMTGAKNFVGNDSLLQFSLPRFQGLKANKVRISVNPADYYTVELFKIRGADVQSLDVQDMVPGEMLAAMFTRMTGLETRL